MAAERMMSRADEFLENEDPFRKSAILIIKEMVDLSKPPPDPPSVLLDEILHSIFFLGKINKPPYSPKQIVTDDDMLNALKGRYPQPFALYSCQLPKRSPFSCVLDMIVDLIGRENENKIKQKLQKLILKLKEAGTNHLVSTTICVSQANPKVKDSVRHYGVSMSTSGPNPGKIVVAASCLSAWDSYVAGAVMTYYPESGSKKVKKTYFDGTIKLPEQVRCEAFSLSNGRQMPPCRSCGNLFGLTTSETREWPYGHCAEAESVSNLLKNDKGVKEQAKPTSLSCTAENRKRAKDSVFNELNGFLKTQQFKWDTKFYTPQTVQS